MPDQRTDLQPSSRTLLTKAEFGIPRGTSTLTFFSSSFISRARSALRSRPASVPSCGF